MGFAGAIAFAVGIVVAEHGPSRSLPSAALCAVAAMVWVVGCVCPFRLRHGAWLLTLGLLGAARARAVVAPPSVADVAAATDDASLWRVRIEGPCMRAAPPGLPATVAAPVQLLAVQRGADGANAWQPHAGRVHLQLRDDVDIAAGDVLQLPMTLRPLPAARAPWHTPLAARARAQQLAGTATAQRPPVRLQSGRGLAASCDRLRLRVGRRMDAALPPHLAPLAKAVALGDATSVPAPQRDRFGDAGIAHLLAVSGLHVSIVARLVGGGVYALLRLGFWPGCVWPARLHAGVSLLAVWGYACWVGAGVSVLRAAWMASAALLARALGCGGRGGVRALGLAGLCLLLRDPLALFSASALLSFASVAGLLTLSMSPPVTRTRIKRLCVNAAGALCEGAIVSIVTWPICAAFFGRVSLVAPLCNLVAIPLGALLATPASLALAVAAAGPWRAALVPPSAWLSRWALSGLDTLAARAAAPWWAAWVSPPWPPSHVVALGCVLLALVVWRWRVRQAPWLRGRADRAAALLLLAAGLAVVVPAAGLKPASPALASWRVWQLDVGQGEATLLGFPDGAVALVDGGGATWPGGRDPGRAVVMPALRAFGARRLDLVVLTHPHPDHMMGLVEVVRQMPVRRLVYNADAEHSPCVAALAATVRARGGQAGAPAPRYTFGGVTLDVMAAAIGVDAATPAAKKRTVNDRSLVIRATFGATSMLLTGDIEAAAERALAPQMGPVDLLQVAHHGSNTSTTSAWLAALRPKVAWISCGQRNRFDFPHPAVCARLQRVVPHVWSTAARGTLMAHSDGRRFVFTCGAGGPC